ncbi:MAG: CBS domain-containing protein [Planctomycetales bacterium]|nr:CBS domain-containing protein [Planctomycetales bacterium]
MNSAIERLLSLRVQDVMNSQVVPIPDHYTMSEAACLLKQNHISGAPVVDSLGKCVGVISTSDFVTKEAMDTCSEELGFGSHHVVSEGTPCRPLSIEEVNSQGVRQHMCTAVRSVRPEATIMEASRSMCGDHLHRLIVLDESGRVAGVVSSLDIVASMVAAIEE